MSTNTLKAMAQNKNCHLCDIVSIGEFLPPTVDVENDFESIGHWQFENSAAGIKDFIYLGQDFVSEDKEDISTRLIERDFAKFAIFDGTEATRIGFFHYNFDEGQQCNLLQNSILAVLSKYFKRKEEEVLVLQNLRVSSKRFDFLIFNYTNQYILNLQSLPFLDKIDTDTKAKNQAESSNAILQKMFGKDLKGKCYYSIFFNFRDLIHVIHNFIIFMIISGKWRYISSVCCNEVDQRMELCRECKPFVSQKQKDLHTMLDFVSNYWHMMKLAVETNKLILGDQGSIQMQFRPSIKSVHQKGTNNRMNIILSQQGD